jgi:hypothetical protein
MSFIVTQNEGLSALIRLLPEIVEALEVGADAVLDRDWACYSAGEREDAEAIVEARFGELIRAIRVIGRQDA